MYNSNKAGLILATPGFCSPAFGPVGCHPLSSQGWCWSGEKGIQGWHLHESRDIFPLPSIDQFGSDQHFPELGGQSARRQEQRHTNQSSLSWVNRGFVCKWQDSSFLKNVAALRSSNCRWISRDRHGITTALPSRQKFLSGELIFRIQCVLLLLKGIF